MRDFKSILYASHAKADETEGLKQAISLARNSGATLRVLVVCPPLPRELQEFSEKYEESLTTQARESVAKTMEALGTREEVEISIGLVTDEKPAVRIIQEVLRGRHDLLIKEAESTGRGEGFWATDMALLRKCPCPVWLSRPIEAHRQEISVAVAVNPEARDGEGRNLAVSLIRAARSLADDCSGLLKVVACTNYAHESFLRNNPWAKVAAPEVEAAAAAAIENSRAHLEELVREAGGAGEHEIDILHGEAELAIPQFANSDGVDVLVMGSVARSGIHGLLLGNTAENIAQSLCSSLIVIKPVDFVSPVKL